jgi:hypothetical protein
MALHDIDDQPFHQSPLPFNIAATSDPHFNDGYFFAFYAPGWYVITGLRLHPNTNTMDGFASVVHDGVQRNVRLSRVLRPDFDSLEIGPLALDIVEPMHVHRLRLGPTPEGLSFDVTMRVQAPPFVETDYRHYKYGKLINDLVRYTQVCQANGSIILDGEEVAVDGWHAMRDHSWGIRSSMGPRTPVRGVPLADEEPDTRALRLWVPFQTDDHCGFFHTHEDGQGRTLDFEGRLHYADGTPVELVEVKHNLIHDTKTGRLLGGSFELTGEDDVVREYRVDVDSSANVQGLGYYNGWKDGGSAGVYRGVEQIEHDRHSEETDDGRSAADHIPSTKRLQPTEYACRIHGPGDVNGMGHLEHTVFRPYSPYAVPLWRGAKDGA